VRFSVPPRYLAEFTLGASTYATDAALHRGWVDEVVEPADLMSRAMVVAQSYAALSPPAFAQTKSQIRALVAERLSRNGQATDKAVTDIWCAPEALSRVRDYVAKTLKK
jgi:enoyl-CoA hydratase